MRKLFFLFVALLATTSLWAQTFQVGDLYYKITSSSAPYTVEVSDAVSSITTAIIPSTVTRNGTTYSVTSIGYEAFYGCSSLTSVTIPNSVTSIKTDAFRFCSSLPVENNLRYADTYLVEAVDKTLSTYSIKEGTKWIGSYAFLSCSSLTSITIPNSVTSIGDEAFRGCSSLTSVTIPNSVTSIGFEAFYYCSSLTSVTIGNSVTSIKTDAFRYCSSLTSIVIPESVTSIGQMAFCGCSSLSSITCLGTTPPTLGTNVFTYLPAVYIPDNTLSAYQTAWGNEYVFVNNETTLTLHVATLGTLEDLIFDAGTRPVLVAKLTLTGTLNDADFTCMRETMTSLVDLDLSGITNTSGVNFKGKARLVRIILPTNLTSIGEEAFYDCSLISITIPNSVTSIGDRAFLSCSSLTSITIPNSVTSIGERAFSGCSSLTSVTIGNSVTSIGDRAFYDCSSLTSITIPNSVTTVGGGMFYGCRKLKSVVLSNNITSLRSYNEYSSNFGFFENCSSLISIPIPNSVTSIGWRAFYDCRSLTSITIPNSVKSIGFSAFYYCSSLTSVTIGNSVTSIESGAFRYCSSLTSITCLGTTPPEADNLGAPTTTCTLIVPQSAYNAYLRHTYWGQFLNIISGYAVTLHTNNEQWGEVTGDGLYTNDTTITITATPYEGYTFLRWSDGNTDNPRTLTLTQDTVLTAEFATIAGQCGDDLYWSYDETAKTVSITGSGEMYDYTADTQPWLLFKEEIKEVIIANTATSIGTSAFEGCIRLGKVSIGTAMVNIGANAFAGCTRLYHIYCYPTYPPFADESSFANYNVYLHVPCNKKEEYDLDIVWGKFKSIECLSADEVEDTEDVEIDAGSTDVTITWPTAENADSYSLVINKDNQPFCTLTFNQDGQLLNIAFAPSRDGNNRPAQYAEQAVNGYRFTVTGLTEATQYAYNITTKDAANKTIATYSGEFTTMGGTTTDMDNIQSPMTNCQKILRNGQLLILRDGVEYNAIGQEL